MQTPIGSDFAAASRAPLLPSPAAAAVAVPSYAVRTLAVDSPHRLQLTRRARPPLAAGSTMALFTARADGRSASPAPLDFCKAFLWQVIDASIDLRDPNPN